MIVVKVELWPGGDESRKQDLGTAHIFNLSGLAPVSRYGVQLLKGARYSQRAGEVYKTGEVPAYPRTDKRWGPWELIALALDAANRASDRIAPPLGPREGQPLTYDPASAAHGRNVCSYLRGRLNARKVERLAPDLESKMARYRIVRRDSEYTGTLPEVCREFGISIEQVVAGSR